MTATAISPVVLDLAKIRRLRLKLKLSLNDAAKRAKLAGKQSWYEVESGRKPNVTIDTLNRIAAALGVKPKDLLK